MKKLLLLLSITAPVLLFSCTDDRLEYVAQSLESMPIFIDNETREEHTVTYADKVMEIKFKDDTTKPQWAKDLIGYDWVPQAIFHRLLGGSTPTMLLGAIMKTEAGGNPVDEMLDLMEKEQAAFRLIYASKTFDLTPKDVRAIMNDDGRKEAAAPLVASQAMRLVESFNKETLGSPTVLIIEKAKAKMVNAAMENDTIFFNINHIHENIDQLNGFAENLLFSNLVIPVHCYNHHYGIAFRYHNVADAEGLNSTEFNSSNDVVRIVSQEQIEEAWQTVHSKSMNK